MLKKEKEKGGRTFQSLRKAGNKLGEGMVDSVFLDYFMFMKKLK